MAIITVYVKTGYQQVVNALQQSVIYYPGGFRCLALQAFGDGDYRRCVELLRPIRSIAQRFGGSHAQRDLLDLTLLEAALRGGELALGRALAAERLQAGMAIALAPMPAVC